MPVRMLPTCLAALAASVLGLSAPQAAATAKQRLDALMSFIEKGQESGFEKRHKVERIVARTYDWAGRVKEESVSYNIKVGETTYQVSAGNKDSQAVGFWVRSKKAPETWFSDADRDGRVDRGHYMKKKRPAEKRELTPDTGSEHREFWQGEYEKTLDELCRHLGI